MCYTFLIIFIRLPIDLAPVWHVDNCLDYDKQPQRQRQRAFHGRLQFCIFKLNNVPRKYEIYVCVCGFYIFYIRI